MDVPVEAGAVVEGGVELVEESPGDAGGDVEAEDVVEEGEGEDFVDVEGDGGETEGVEGCGEEG